MWRVLFLAIFCIAVLCAGYTSADEPLSLDQIIDRVQKNEQLYDDIEVVLSEKYRDYTAQPAAEGESIQIIAARDGDVRYVAQGGMFRVDSNESLSYPNGKTFIKTRTRVFDGQTTRILSLRKGQPDGTPSSIVGRADDEKTVRPHMLLLRMTRHIFPLSTYLKGDKAIEAYPHSGRNPGLTVDVSYRGPVTRKGMRCHEVWISNKIKESGDIHDRYVLWLAEERNYIPVRSEGYTFRWSKDLPVAESDVTEWRELRKGVWFPIRGEVSRYDSFTIQREGKMVLSWQQQYTVKSVSLNPKVGKSFFQVLPTGKGT
jgi:hypothetical protein